LLEQAVAEHERSDPREVPRSFTYLATAQRLAGDPAAGLRSTQAGLDRLGPLGGHDWTEKTRAYLKLERGRCLLALGRAREALAVFDVAARLCECDHEHPRSAALRGLTEANRLLGNQTLAADYYDRCLAVAEQQPGILGQVAGMAIADKWASTDLDSREKTVWESRFPKDTQRDSALALRARWIY
jgi:tetratricopeptide (TPR) repeat protein